MTAVKGQCGQIVASEWTLEGKEAGTCRDEDDDDGDNTTQHNLLSLSVSLWLPVLLLVVN